MLHDEEDDNGQLHDLPHYYAPQPYLLPDPNIDASLRDRPLPITPADVPQTPTTTTYTRKSSVPAPMRPVNIIQHDDAGPSNVGEPETIELPPAYTHIRSSQRSPGIVPTPTTVSTESTTS